MYIIRLSDVMEYIVDKSFDVDKILGEVEKALEKYESEKTDFEVLESISVNVISGLTDIL